MVLRVFLLMGFFLLVGCAAQGPISAETPAPPAGEAQTPEPGSSQPSAAPAGSPNPGAAPFPSAEARPALETLQANPTVEALTALAKERLASKLMIETSKMTVFSIQARDWPDESLGCPIGGQNYAQVITPGYLIELEVDKAIYSFHTDRGSQVILCGIEPPHEIFNPP